MIVVYQVIPVGKKNQEKQVLLKQVVAIVQYATRIPFAIIELHVNECLNKKQQSIIYSVDSVPREEDKDYEIEEDEDAHGDVNTFDYKKQILVVLKHCNIAKE